jgi:hypothetical protein
MPYLRSCCRDKFFQDLIQSSRQAQGSTQFPIHWLPEASKLGGKLEEREALPLHHLVPRTIMFGAISVRLLISSCAELN